MTGGGMQPPAAQSAREVEAALAGVRGVVSAVVTTATTGAVTSIRLTLEAGADEPAVAEGAHAELRRNGIVLDPGRVQLVQAPGAGRSPSPHLHVVPGQHRGPVDPAHPEDLDDLLARLDGLGETRYDDDVLDAAERHPSGSVPPPRAAVPTPGQRLALGDVVVTTHGLRATTTVGLRLDGVEHRGTAEGDARPEALLRTLARATVLSVVAALGGAVVADLVDVVVVPVGSGEVCLVQVAWGADGVEERLTGAAGLRDDPRDAVVRATLDAVNRRLAPALTR